ncbi:MAG: deoxyribose-phosphate aldolase [Candidatus Coatesbacteria bacterium]|nr:MAG: deoxyribose-phosphate aldolase [Candidatus Coatesbacteria bacterium]
MATSRTPQEWLAFLPGRVEQTLLGYDVSREQIASLCEIAVRENFYAVVVNPTHVRFASERLAAVPAKAVTVIGFPMGANTKAVKVYETRDAINRGADELDLVVNVSALTHGYYDFVREEIRAVVEAALDRPVKVILECGALDADQKTTAAKLAEEAGAAFVKTSTGFGPGGATEADVRLLRKVVGDRLGIKASGGIRSYERAVNLLEAGADRIGTSSGVVIMEGLRYAVKAGRLGDAVASR